MIARLPLIICALLVLGCERDALDVDLLADIELKPTLEAPLVTTYFELADWVNQDSFAVVDDDRFVRVLVEQDSLLRFGLTNLIGIRDQDYTLPRVPAINGSISDSILLDLGNAADLVWADCATGFLRLTMNTEGFSEAATFAIAFPGSVDANGSTLASSLVIPQGSAQRELVVDLRNTRLNLGDESSSSFNELPVRVELINGNLADTSATFQLDLNFSNLEPDRVRGRFKEASYTIDNQLVEADLLGVKDILQGISIRDPSLSLFSRNSLPLPIDITPEIRATTANGIPIRLGGQQFQARAGTFQFPSIDSVSYTSGNSSITEFLATLPPFINIGGGVGLPNTASNDFVTIDRRQSLVLDATLELPLDLMINGAVTRDTIDFDLSDTDVSDLKDLTLLVNSANRFPFGLKLDLIFLDAGDKEIPELDFTIAALEAATVGADGRIIGEAFASNPLPFTNEMLDLIPTVKRLIARVTATSSLPNDFVKIYDDYGFKVTIAARSTVLIKLGK